MQRRCRQNKKEIQKDVLPSTDLLPTKKKPTSRKVQRTEVEEIEFQDEKKEKNKITQRRCRNKKKENQIDLSLSTNAEPVQTETLDRLEDFIVHNEVLQSTQNSNFNYSKTQQGYVV